MLWGEFRNAVRLCRETLCGTINIYSLLFRKKSRAVLNGERENEAKYPASFCHFQISPELCVAFYLCTLKIRNKLFHFSLHCGKMMMNRMEAFCSGRSSSNKKYIMAIIYGFSRRMLKRTSKRESYRRWIEELSRACVQRKDKVYLKISFSSQARREETWITRVYEVLEIFLEHHVLDEFAEENVWNRQLNRVYFQPENYDSQRDFQIAKRFSTLSTLSILSPDINIFLVCVLTEKRLS